MSKATRTAAKVARYATGLDAVADVGKAAAAPATAAGRLLATLWRMAQPAKAEGWLDHVDDAAERFRLASDRYHFDCAALLSRARRSFAIHFCLTTLLLAIGIVTAPENVEKHGWLVGLIFSFCPLPAFGSLMFQSAFFHWQVRTRRLARVGEWLRQPGEWLPKSNVAALLIVLGIATLAPGSAFAQTAADSSDIALNIVRTILPVSGGTIGATGLSAGLTALGATLVLIMAGMLCYQIVIGIAATAHEGRVLGSWNAMWSPIRLSIGFSTLAPIINGWPAGALLVYQLAVWSCGLGNSVWNGAVTYLLSPAAATTEIGIPPSIGGLTLAEQIAKGDMCAQIVIALTPSIFKPLASLPAPAGTFIASPSGDGNGTQTWNYGGRCGGFTLPVPAKTAPAPMIAYSAARIAALSNLMTTLRSTGLIDQMAGATDGVEEGTIEWPMLIYPAFQSAGKAYDSAMLSASATYASNQRQTTNSNLKLAANVGGWMTAFGFDRPLAQASNQVGTIASEAPAWVAPGAVPYYVAAARRMDTQIQEEQGAGALTATDMAAGAQSESNWLGRVLEPVDHRVSKAVIDWAASSSTDKIGDLMDEGAKLSAAGEAGIVADVGLSFVACNELGKLSGACDAFKQATTFARPIFYAAVMAGTTLQYLLPMQPWIAGLWLETSWIIAFAQVIICIPIWSFLMCRIDGQELIDSVQRPFVIVLANWFLTPPLAVLAFVVFREVEPLGIGLIQQGFSTVFVGSQGGHYNGILGTLVGVGLQNYLCYQMTIRLAQLIVILPREIPNLIGAPGGGAIGDAADSLREGNRTLAVIASNTAQTGQKLGGGGGASKIPKSGGGGGGEAPGLRVSGDDGGGGGSASKVGGGEPHWTKMTGGVGGLSDGQRAAASAAFDEWAQENPAAAAKYGFDGYASYSQEQEAAKNR